MKQKQTAPRDHGPEAMRPETAGPRTVGSRTAGSRIVAPRTVEAEADDFLADVDFSNPEHLMLVRLNPVCDDVPASGTDTGTGSGAGQDAAEKRADDTDGLFGAVPIQWALHQARALVDPPIPRVGPDGEGILRQACDDAVMSHMNANPLEKDWLAAILMAVMLDLVMDPRSREGQLVRVAAAKLVHREVVRAERRGARVVVAVPGNMWADHMDRLEFPYPDLDDPDDLADPDEPAGRPRSSSGEDGRARTGGQADEAAPSAAEPSGQNGQTGKTGKAGKAEETGRAGRAEETGKAGKDGVEREAGQNGMAGKPDPGDRPEQPGQPDAADRFGLLALTDLFEVASLTGLVRLVAPAAPNDPAGQAASEPASGTAGDGQTRSRCCAARKSPGKSSDQESPDKESSDRRPAARGSRKGDDPAES